MISAARQRRMWNEKVIGKCFINDVGKADDAMYKFHIKKSVKNKITKLMKMLFSRTAEDSSKKKRKKKERKTLLVDFFALLLFLFFRFFLGNAFVGSILLEDIDSLAPQYYLLIKSKVMTLETCFILRNL